jgi:hypothetical protein
LRLSARLGSLRIFSDEQKQAIMTPIAQTPPPLPSPTGVSGISIALIVVMWIAWVALVLAADFLAVMMFAFADSPGAGKAAQAMIVPVFGWLIFTFLAGVLLLIFRGWWQVPLAFALAVSPPFMVFLGYNLLMAKPTAPNIPPPPPGQTISMPPGGFAPTSVPTYQPTFKIPQQPDWRAATRPTTEPTDDRR